MKHLKLYENFESKDFKRGDLIKQKSFNNEEHTSYLFLVLKDGTSIKTDNWFGKAGKIDIIDVILIGQIGQPKLSKDFKSGKSVYYTYLHLYVDKPNNIDNDQRIIFLTEIEKDRVYSEIANFNTSAPNGMLNLLKNRTDVDLKETEEYKNWLIKKDLDKYNL